MSSSNLKPPHDGRGNAANTANTGDHGAGGEPVDTVLDGKFALRELIGEGPFGRVYRAEQVALGRSVMLRVIDSASERGGELARRFKEQAFAVTRLHHPNVVAIYDYGQTGDGTLYLAMEYLSGRRLSSLIRNDPPSSPRRVVALINQVCAALGEAHAAGILHGDLRSDNILVEEQRDGRSLVKVFDFGVARLVNDTGGADGVGGSDADISSFTGSPEYMAPELIVGRPPSRASDIYSIGVVLYELVTGVLPFSDPGQGEASQPGLVAARFTGAELSAASELEQVAMRALAHEAERRYSDAAELSAAIDAALDAGDDGIECPSCGARNESRFRFCAQCGARLVGKTGDRDTDGALASARSQARQAVTDGNHEGGVELFHRAIGRAMRHDNVAQVIDCYCEMATLLARSGALALAIRELEGAIDLVTPSGGTSMSHPDDLWRLQMLLAELYRSADRHRDALATGSRALRSARQASSAHGRKSVQDFMTKLYASARQTGPKPVEKLSTTEDESGANPGVELFASGQSIQDVLDTGDTAPWQLLDISELDDDTDGELSGE
ncbi:MAG: protein kinase [Myxococcota bacterium]